jgi:hypothetical protein
MENDIARVYNLGVAIGIALTAPHCMSVDDCKQYLGELIYSQVGRLWMREDVMCAMREAGMPVHITAERVTAAIVREATVAELQTLILTNFAGFENIVFAAAM